MARRKRGGLDFGDSVLVYTGKRTARDLAALRRIPDTAKLAEALRPAAPVNAKVRPPLSGSQYRRMYRDLPDDLFLRLWHDRDLLNDGEQQAVHAERHRRRQAEYRKRIAEPDPCREWLDGGIYAARTALGKTIADLARESGISFNQIARAEKNGIKAWSLENILHLCRALELHSVVMVLQPALYRSRPEGLDDGRSDPASYRHRRSS